jgi:hypothetical protein
MALVSRVSSRGRGKGRVTYQESWLAIDASFSLSFDCQAFREIGSGIFLKMGILSSFSTMPGGLLCIPLKWLNSLRSLSVRCPRPICGFEEKEEDVSYHRPPAIKRTKPMPTIAATASIPGEWFENLEKVVAVLLVPLLGSPEGPSWDVVPVLATSVFTRALPPPPLGSNEMTAIQKEIWWGIFSAQYMRI